MKIKLCHHEYELTEVEVGEEWTHGMGRSNIKNGTIRICAGMPPGVRESTILHELIHQIADMNDLTRLKEDETAISVLAVGILDCLRGNPLLARQICGE